jgi:hypothetical protein
MEDQLSQQKLDDKIKTKEAPKRIVSQAAKSKLRKATAHDESKEIRQQKIQDYKEHKNTLICASPPDPNYPSGILSIQIHNITGLKVEIYKNETRMTSWIAKTKQSNLMICLADIALSSSTTRRYT